MRRQRINLTCWQLVSAVLLIPVAPTLALNVESNDCWSTKDDCVIQATLQQGTESPAVVVPVEIDCSANLENGEVNPATPLLRRFVGVQNVTLDGCHAPLRSTTYGFEFLPNCNSILQVTVKRFHADVLQPFQCSVAAAGIQAEIICFQNNDIGSLAADSFIGLPQLRELHFVGNSLRHIERNAFDALRVVEVVHIENEPLLYIKEGDILERTSAVRLQLIALRQITAQLFQHLPESLRQVYIAQTSIEGDAVEVINPQVLGNVSIIDCGLISFTLLDPHANVLHVNLSGNSIINFHVELASNKSSESAMETLDLGYNKLTYLRTEWLSNLKKLRHLVLRGNLLKSLSLPALLAAAPAAQLIDLRENQLVALRETTSDIDSDHARVQIDRNPWNCMWLLDFAHTYPEKFRIFQYDKFISQINVNGLACNPSESSTEASNSTKLRVKDGQLADNSTTTHLNVSTYTLIYGSPWDIKRNQRAEALIIVFMLPLGVALLFLLLYLWIYCQKVFHLSFYRSLSFMGHQNAIRSAERFDVVRHLPPATMNTNATGGANINDGYELPLNGISLCNCNNITADKCTKLHHVTYEAYPTEPPYMIPVYEEIIEATNNDSQLADSVHPLYDHLTFEQNNKES